MKPTSELSDVSEDVLEAVGELESVHVAQTVLHVGVHHQLRQPQDLKRRRIERRWAVLDTPSEEIEYLAKLDNKCLLRGGFCILRNKSDRVKT